MKTLFYFAFIFLLNGSLTAQNKGSIRGKVVDDRSNTPILGANVIILGEMLGSITDSTGWYHINNIEEGIYEIQVSYIGYRTYRKPDIRVVRNKTTQVTEINISESTIETGEVTVTAGVFQDNNDMPVSSFNFTNEEIKRAPGAAGDIFRALATMPGVATEGGEVSAFSVRGGSPRDNLILVDNIPFTKVSHFDDGGIEGEESEGGRFGVFAPSLVEKADFSAGGFPARYGGKNSSIIDMEIKEGNTKDMTIYGHYDLFGWEANYDGPLPINDKSGLIVSVRHVDFKTILKMIGEEGHGNPAYTDVLLKNSIELDPSHKISLFGIYSDDKYERTVDNVFLSEDINENELIKHKDSRYLLGMNGRSLLGSAGYIKTTGYYYSNDVIGKEGRVNTAMDYGNVPVKGNSYIRNNINEIDVKETTFGFKSDLSLSLNRNLNLFAGVEGKRNRYHFKNLMNGPDTMYVFDESDHRPDPSKYFIVITPQEYNQDNIFSGNYYAGYAEISVTPLKKLTLNPSIRYEYYTYNNASHVSPRMSLRYQMTADISFNASTGLYYQMPELAILSFNKSNGYLKNEQAIHFIAGTSVYLSRDLKMTAEVYYKKFDDLLVRMDSYERTYSNSGTGSAGGFDLGLVKRFTDNYYGQVCYSYCNSRRNDNNGEGKYESSTGKPHMFKILGGYQFNEEWSLTAKWVVTSGLPTDDYIVHENVLNDPNVIRYSAELIRKNGHRFAPNQNFDIRVDYRKQLKYFALNFYLDVWNLFDKVNITKETFLPQNGKFSNEALGMVPSFGFNLEF